MSFFGKITSALVSQERYSPPNRQEIIVNALTFVFKTTVDKIETSNSDLIQLINPENVREGFHKVIKISLKAMEKCILPMLQNNDAFKTCDFTLSLVDEDALKALEPVKKQLSKIYMTRLITKAEEVVVKVEKSFKYGGNMVIDNESEIDDFPVLYVINPFYLAHTFSHIKKKDEKSKSSFINSQSVKTIKILASNGLSYSDVETICTGIKITDPQAVYMKRQRKASSKTEKLGSGQTCVSVNYEGAYIGYTDGVPIYDPQHTKITTTTFVPSVKFDNEKNTVYLLTKAPFHDPTLHFPVRDFEKIGLAGVSICADETITVEDTKFLLWEVSRKLRQLPLTTFYDHKEEDPKDPPTMESIEKLEKDFKQDLKDE